MILQCRHFGTSCHVLLLLLLYYNKVFHIVMLGTHFKTLSFHKAFLTSDPHSQMLILPKHSLLVLGFLFFFPEIFTKKPLFNILFIHLQVQ